MSQFSITPEDETTKNNVYTAKYEQMVNAIKSKQSIPMAILGGLTGSVVAALIWAIITFATGYQIGFMAIGVGFLVGFAVKFFGKGITTPFGVVGAFFALLGCVLGNIFTTIIAAAFQEGYPTSSILAAFLTDPTLLFQIMKATFSPMDILFYGIAVYEGYRFSFYEIDETELANVEKDDVPPPPEHFEKPSAE